MKGMLIKDFCYLKGQKQFLAVLGIMMVVFFGFTDSLQFGIGYLIVMMGIVAVSTLAYDEFDNGNPFLFTLPTSRKGYVREKYVFFIILSVLAWVVGMALGIGANIMRGNTGEEILITLLVSVASLGMGLLMGMVSLPLQLKFGSEKRQIAFVGGFVIVFSLVYIGEKVLKLGDINTLHMMAMMSRIPMWVWVVIGAVIVLVLFFISYLISVRIMDKKEL